VFRRIRGMIQSKLTKGESMQKKIRIVLAEDHIIVRDGIKSLISANPDFEISGEAGDGLEAVRMVDKLKPDLILMDLTMPKSNGLDAIGDIKNRSPETRILILTVHKIEEYVRACLKAGADGYLLKKSSHKELLNAIHHVISGEPYLDPGISDRIIEGYLRGNAKKTRGSLNKLTKREREVLKLVAEGYKNAEISDYLCISTSTVETHRDNLMKKLDLHNAAALTAYAIKQGLAC